MEEESKMKILLIRPRFRDFIYHDPPLGLAYLASVLCNSGNNVRICDLAVESCNLVARIENFKPDIVGITCPFSSQATSMHEVANVVKLASPYTKVVVGGAHPSAMPQEVLKDKNIDIVVIGEGEHTIVELVKAIERGEQLDTIDGVAFRKGTGIKTTKERSPIKDLDSIPFPAWDLLPMKNYLKSKGGHSAFVKRTPYFSMITSRGCPLRCIFCSIHTVWGYQWRARSAENVVKEIEVLVHRYGVREVHFEDDNIAIDKKRMYDICNKIIERDIDVTWTTPNGIAVWTLGKPMLEKMVKSGCFSLCFGLESGNQRIRTKVIGKPIDLTYTKKVIRWCKELGIWTHGFFVLGLPTETEGNFRETINMAKELDLGSASFFIAVPYPGTPLFELCKEKGYIQEFEWKSFRIDEAIIETETFTQEDVRKWRRLAYKEFYFHKVRQEFSPLPLMRRLVTIRSWDDIAFYAHLLKSYYRFLNF